jgi:hypothetical protein
MRTTTHRAGFTLLDTLVTSVCLALVAGGFFTFLNAGTILFAKNTAINLAHHEARVGVTRLIDNIHASASIPQLVDINRVPLEGAGPAAGLSFQLVYGGPYQFIRDPGNPQLVQIQGGPGVVPQVGDRLIVLDYDIEDDIIKITPGMADPNHWNFWLKKGQEARLQLKKDSRVVCYLARRVAYIVAEGQLRFYPDATNKFYAIARNISSPKPFSIPLNSSGTLDTRYTSVTMTVTDPTYKNRSHTATNMQMVDAHIPYRNQMTKYQ